MKNFRKIGKAVSTLSLLTSIGMMLGVGAIQAQTGANNVQSVNEAIALTAVPPRLGDDYSLLVKPGETIQAVIEARNPQDAPVTVETFVRDFIIGDDGDTPIPVEQEDANPRWQLSQWITLTPNSAVIDKRGTSTILVTITVPADAIPGGRYAMILHKPVNSSGGELMDSSGAQINAQVGTLLYVIVDGPVTESAVVDKFAFKGFSEMGPVDYSLGIRNNSSYHIRPNATITIKNWFGAKTGEIALDQKNIFPDSTRGYTGQWNKKWGFGRYTAEITGTYGFKSANTLPIAIAKFWIIPVRLILAIILVIALVAAIIFSTRKKYSKMLEVEEEKVRKLDEKLKKARRN